MFSYASGRVACVNYDFGRVAGIKKVSQMVPSFCRVSKHVGYTSICTDSTHEQTHTSQQLGERLHCPGPSANLIRHLRMPWEDFRLALQCLMS